MDIAPEEGASNPGSPCRVIDERCHRSEPGAVTVIVPLYNYAVYLPACLDSVKAQTLADLDLIIVDDCSRDYSLPIAQEWLRSHGTRFGAYRLLQHHVNQGVAQARNTAFAHARTEYVFVLDADNLLYPRCIERLAAALDNSDASFAHCYLEKFGQASGLVITLPHWNPSSFQKGNRIDAMVLLRQRVWEEVGGYTADAVTRLGWEDFELWFKIARRAGWGVLVPEILARYRVHGSSRSQSDADPNQAALWHYLQNKYPEFFTGGAAPDPMYLVGKHDQERGQLMEELASVYHSRSWKVTYPFRFVTHQGRRLRRWVRRHLPT